MDPSEIREKHKKYLFPNVATYYNEPLVPLKANGVIVTGGDGKEYLDFFGGILTVSVGHCHPKVTDAAIEQQRKYVHMSTLYPMEPQVRLAEKLASIAPFEDAKSFFTNSGTEADETAVVLAKLKTGNRDIIALRHGYAGRSAFAISATGHANWRAVDGDVIGVKHAHAPYCYRCDFRLKYPDCGVACAQDIKSLIQTETRGEVAGMIAEPILGVGGFIVPPKEYFEVASKIVRDHGGVFIADEVQSAWGRTGKWWGSQHFPNFTPDIITSAKGMANGQPIGVTMAPASVADAFTRPSLSTFGGNPVSMAASVATIEVLEEENLLYRAQVLGQRLRDGLDQIQRDYSDRIGDVRGLGLMQGVEIVASAASKEPDVAATLRVLEATKKRQLLIGRGGLFGNTLRIAPPLVVNEADVDEALQKLAESFHEAFSA